MKSKAIYYVGNKHMEVREIEIPDPKEDEIQARTIANGICMLEVWQYNHKDFVQPQLAGHEGIGVVTKVGSGIHGVKEGDYVLTFQWSEYTNIHATNIVKLSCRPEEAEQYIVEPVSCAITAVHHLHIYPGEKAIVFGAGYMGLLLIQLLRHAPISELVVVDVKADNLALALQYGADRVIDLRKDGEIPLQEMQGSFDICYEASGAADALKWCTKLAKAGGKLGIYAWHHEPRLVDMSDWHVKGLEVMNVSPHIAAHTKDRLAAVRAADRMMAAGKIRQHELITHRYYFEDIERAMHASTAREDRFIKSILTF